MAQLLVRNLPEEVIRRLKLRAAQHGRSAEAEHRAILEEALGLAKTDFWVEAARLRSQTSGRHHTNGTDLVREERDRRSGHRL